MRRQRPRSFRPYADVVVLALGVAAGLLVASRLSRVLFERPTPARPSVMAAATAGAPPVAGAGARSDGSLFRVVTAEGGVEAYRDGRWLAIRRGDLLTLEDLVRTGAGARAVLKLGASTEIELRERVEIRLDRLSGTGASVDLRRGKLVAHVARAGDNLAITARETRTFNDGPAHFIVMAAESGRVSVAATEGTARFSAAGKQVSVAKGRESHADPDAPPSDPEEIPEDVLLSVVWPEAERHAASAPVRGTVGPSSVVTVNGTPVVVAPDGRFTASVPLREGSNEVKVEAEDLAGRRRTSTTTLMRQPARPPKLAAEPGELWNK
jgi:hypothetical protein